MLTGKTALVTGSTSGIGLAIAEALAGQNANVVINSFTDTEADRQLAETLAQAHGVEVAYISADMSDGEACAELVEETIARFGALDILVNNAGIQHVAPIEDFPVDKWNAIVAINLSSSFHTIRAAVPGMKARGWGRIVNVASAHGLVASPYKSAYVAAKHGVVGLTKVTALENAGTGVTCNAICPGWVRTALVEKQIEALAQKNGIGIEAAAKELLAEKQPSLQFVTPKQLAGAAVFIASEAADQMTGTTLTLDGGWTAR